MLHVTDAYVLKFAKFTLFHFLIFVTFKLFPNFIYEAFKTMTQKQSFHASFVNPQVFRPAEPRAAAPLSLP